MPDFNKGSTFNKDANFQGVKFGADAPLLETELNELQDIQTEARADIIRDTIPSGFVQLGELDFDYMLNNENCVKMKTDSVAYVNGYKVVIPKDTIVDIGKAPEKDAREDLLFLEVWKEEVTKDSVLTVAGGEGQAQINNPILDDRVGQETARRIALKWRIRHVADVDFNTYPEGFHRLGLGWSDNAVIAQGGNTEPIRYNKYSSYFNANVLTTIANATKHNDCGLYIAGDGGASGKQYLKTFDGYVYAIPMFKLYRKPSCGKAIPFEYQKINPKVDYSKFTDLMKEEKVERVVNETIGGRSLVNLDVLGLGKDLVVHDDSNRYRDIYRLNLVANKQYTIVFNISDNNGSLVYYELYYSDSSSNTSLAFDSDSNKNGLYKYLITPTKDVIKIRVKISASMSESGKTFSTSDLMILEGDWTDKETPEYFTGLKSLGEDEGNLITVKNAILNESSYDPDTGTPKLTTVEGVNHISSENLIMPNIEAQVKRGETKLSDLNSFDKVDNMVGDEVVDFTKIKGRTLQNLLTSPLTSGKIISSDIERCQIEIIDNYQALTVLDSKDCMYNLTTLGLSLLKPSTKYTFVVEVEENTCSGDLRCNTNLQCVFTNGGVQSSVVFCKAKEIGTFVWCYQSEANPQYYHIPIKISGCNTGEKIKYRIMILEGDYTNIPLDQLPYTQDIKSVGEDEDNKLVIKRTGKNLLNKFSIKQNAFIKNTGDIVYDSRWRISRVKVEEGKEYILSGLKTFPNTNTNNYLFYKDDTLVSHKSIGNTIAVIPPSGVNYIEFCWKGDDEDTVQFEEGTVATEYEPYKEYKQEITLMEYVIL